MPDYTVKDETSGKTITFRWDGQEPPTDADMEEVFAAAQSAARVVPETKPAADFMGIPGLRVGPAAPGSANEKIQGGLKWAGNVISSITGMGDAGTEAVDNPKTTLALSAIGPVAKVASNIVPRALGISAARAAGNIQSASSAARGANVPVEQVGRQGLRALELNERGNYMPRVVSQFMRRITDPKAADLAFDEGRDWYSSISRMSADDFNKMTPAMKKQVGAIRQALHEAMTESAQTVGRGRQYEKGISEYRRAMKAKEVAKKIAKYGAGAAGAGAAGSMLLD